MDPEELLRQLQAALDEGALGQVYKLASVSVDSVLTDLRDQGVEVRALGEVARIPVPLLDKVADRYIQQAQVSGAIAGGVFGSAGFLSIPPELILMMARFFRLAQRLSLTYGHEVNTNRGSLELWNAIARAMGVKLDIEGSEESLYRGVPAVLGRGPFRDPLLFRVVQKVAQTMAIRAATQVSRLVPLLGAGVGGLSTWLWMRRVGVRLKDEMRTRHELRFMNLSDTVVSEEIAYTLKDRQS